MTIPLIVISSPKSGAGKTTLAFNLASALLHDGYNVGIYSDFAPEFLQKRAELQKSETALKIPQNISKEALFAGNFSNCNAIIVDVPSEQNSVFIPILAQAHTLITLIKDENDLSWQPQDAYLNIIWNVKKQQAAQGIKYLNWSVAKSLIDTPSVSLSQQLEQQSRRFGFRLAPALCKREAYTHIKDGYGAADLISTDNLKMSMSDVYARRELLILADFIWQHK